MRAVSAGVILVEGDWQRILERWTAPSVAVRVRAGSEAFTLAGAARDGAGSVSYGGMHRRASAVAFKLAPSDSLTAIDTFKGNMANGNPAKSLRLPDEAVEPVVASAGAQRGST